MEENQIIVDVGLDAFIQSLRHLQKQYELNTAALKAMKDAGEEQSDAYIMLTQEQKVLRQQIASTEKTMQNEIKMQQAQEGSLVQLRAQLANLQKQYDSMSGMERMGEAGVALQKRIKALHDEVLGLEGDTGRMQRNVGNYPGAVKPLIEELERLTKQLEDLRAENKEGSDEFAAVEKRIGEVNQSITQLTGKVDGLATDTGNVKQQMRELTENLIAMKMRGEENTEQYRQMLEQLGKMKDAMMDTQNQVKQMASDTSNLNSVLAGAQAAAGGFSVALGVMNLVGDKDSETAKELAEAQQKLQSAIAITTGLQALQNALQKESALMMGVNKIRMLAAAAAQRAYAAATRDAEAAQAVFNKVAKSNIYVWLASIILTVVGAIYAFTRGSKEQEEQTEKTNIQLKTQAEYLQQLNDQYQTLAGQATKEAEARLANAKAHGKSTEEIRKYENELFDVQIANLNALEEKLGYSRRAHEKLKWEYERQVQEYEEGVRRMAENAGKVPQVVTEVAQAALDQQKAHLEEAKKMLDQFDALVDERTRLNTERAQQVRDRQEQDEEAARAAAAAAKQRHEERIARIKKEREEMTAALDDVISKLKTAEERDESLTAANERLAQSMEKLIPSIKGVKDETEGFIRIAPMVADGQDKVAEHVEKMEPTLGERFAAAAEMYKDNVQAVQEVNSALTSSFGSLSSMYQQIANDESKTQEEREEAARKAKAWSSVQIAANAGAAVAKGVASAVDVGFPAAIPAMATMTAAILSAIAQAKALLAEAHEHGGVIGGKFVGATSGSDNVLMTGRRGELVLNADQQKRLYDIANGSASSNLTASLVEALQAMPAPVLVYSELKRFENNVNILDELSNLN